MPKYALATNWRILLLHCGLAGASMRDRVIDWPLRGPGKGCVEASSLLVQGLQLMLPFLVGLLNGWTTAVRISPPGKRKRTIVARHHCPFHHFPKNQMCTLECFFEGAKYLVES